MGTDQNAELAIGGSAVVRSFLTYSARCGTAEEAETLALRHRLPPGCAFDVDGCRAAYLTTGYDDGQGQMSWRPSEDHDREMRRWMESKGWPVTSTDYHFDHEIYAWRHDLPGGNSPTLRISRMVLEKHPAFLVAYHLEKLKVARELKTRPAARLVVVQKGAQVTLEEVPPK